jgi:hypothetical protein
MERRPIFGGVAHFDDAWRVNRGSSSIGEYCLGCGRSKSTETARSTWPIARFGQFATMIAANQKGLALFRTVELPTPKRGRLPVTRNGAYFLRRYIRHCADSATCTKRRSISGM